jgi:outer membrane protein assembly factor BamB
LLTAATLFAVTLFAVTLPGTLTADPDAGGRKPVEALKLNDRERAERNRRMQQDSALLDLDAAATKKLAAVEDLISAGAWGEAVSQLIRLPEEHPTRLVAGVDRTFTTVANRCQQVLSTLPADALRRYRERVDPQAALLWKEASAARDPALLLAITRRAFLSSFGDDACWLLGELAWERGEPAAARGWFRRLIPLSDEMSPSITYPDSQYPAADVLARILLCDIAMARYSFVEKRLAEFKNDFPNARGRLGGEEGEWHALIERRLIEASESPGIEPAPPASTFACNPQRGGRSNDPPDVGAMLWSTPLTRISIFRREIQEGIGFGRVREVRPFEPQPCVTPVVWDGNVFFCDDTTISAVRLSDGSPAWDAGSGGSRVIYQLPDDLDVRRWSIGKPVGVPAYTVTVEGGRLFARMGRVGERSRLVCLDVGEGQGRTVWELRDEELPEPSVSFEGSPVAVDGRLYVAMRRNVPQSQLFVGCFRSIDGRVLWVRKACNGASRVLGEPTEYATLHVTVADGRCLVNTNHGAVVAFDALDGHTLWASTYDVEESTDMEEWTSRRLGGPNPCCVHEGIVYVAPYDSSRILALSAESGIRIPQWKDSGRQAPKQLLGVDSGWLVAADRNRLHLFDALTGRRGPHLTQAEVGEESFGRGLLFEGQVFWPTRKVILVYDLLRLRSLRSIEIHALNGMSGGNLVAADGRLIVASHDQVACFNDAGGWRKRHEDLFMQRPNDPAAAYRLAVAQLDSGEPDHALELLRQARGLLNADSLLDGKPLEDRLRSLQISASQRLARQQLATDQFDAARDTLLAVLPNAATLSRLRGPDCAVAAELLLDVAGVELAAGQPTSAAEAASRVLRSSSLRIAPVKYSSRIAGEDADELLAGIAAASETIPKRKLSAWFLDIETQFRKSLELGNLEAAESLVWSIPRGVSRTDAAEQLIAEWLKQRDFVSAWRFLTAWFRIAADSEQRAGCLLRIAELFQSAGRMQDAVALRTQLETDWADVGVSLNGKATSVRDWLRDTAPLVEEALRAPVRNNAKTETRSGSAASLPGSALEWTWSAGGDVSVTPIQDRDPKPGVFISSGGRLSYVSTVSGKTDWSVPVDQTVLWGGRVGDVCVAATRDRLIGLHASSGAALWTRSTPGEAAVRFSLAGMHVLRIDAEGIQATSIVDGVAAWRFAPPERLDLDCLAVTEDLAMAVLRSRDRIAALALRDNGSPPARTSLNIPGNRLVTSPISPGEGIFGAFNTSRRFCRIDVSAGLVETDVDPALPISFSHADPQLIADGGRCYALIDGNTLLSLTSLSRSPRVEWSAGIGSGPTRDAGQAVAFSESTVFVPNSTGVVALDRSTGKLAWQFRADTGRESAGRCRRIHGTVLLLPPFESPKSPPDGIAVLDARTGEQTETLFTSGAGPAWCETIGDRLLLADGNTVRAYSFPAPSPE